MNNSYYVESEKDVLKKSLNTNGIRAEIADEYGLIGLKFVNIKENRRCSHCGFTVAKGNLMATGTNNPKLFKKSGTKTVRTYYCKNCIPKVIKAALNDEAEVRDAETHEYALACAFENEF